MIRNFNAEEELDNSKINIRHFQHLQLKPTLMSESPTKLPDDERKWNHRHQDPTYNHHRLNHYRESPVGVYRSTRSRNRSQGDLH